MMRMPTFLVLGVAKAGTTSLYAYLKQHPAIYLSTMKEPHFFAYGEMPSLTFNGPGAENVRKHIVYTLPDYQALFNGWTDELAAGELSTTNFTVRACERIKHYIPSAQLILILRQPTERAYSQFLYTQQVGREPLQDFAQALAAETTRIQQNWLPGFAYRPMGFYSSTLQHYFAHFPREQIRIYLYDEWQAQPLQMLQDLFRFIGVDEHFVPDMTMRHNTGAVPRSRRLLQFMRGPNFLKTWLRPLMPKDARARVYRLISTYNRAKPPALDPQLRAQLNQLYHEDILRTQELIGRDLSHWL